MTQNTSHAVMAQRREALSHIADGMEAIMARLDNLRPAVIPFSSPAARTRLEDVVARVNKGEKLPDEGDMCPAEVFVQSLAVKLRELERELSEAEKYNPS